MSGPATISPPADEPDVLVFGWRRAGSRWRLGLMIFLALLGHAASFYILQVAYTPTGSLLPPPSRVVLVPLDQPGNVPLAHWLSLLDPALTTQPSLPAPDAVVGGSGFRYQPSYEVSPPAFKPLEVAPSTEAVAAPPRAIPPGPVAVAEVAPARSNPPAGSPDFPSRVVFDDVLSALVQTPVPPVPFRGGTGVLALEPTIYLVGMRAEGGAPFLFPVRRVSVINPSVDADEADEFARDYLARLTFRRVDAPSGEVRWGRATFYWGRGRLPKPN